MQVFVFQPIPLTYIGMKSKLLQHKKPKYYYFFLLLLQNTVYCRFCKVWIYMD